MSSNTLNETNKQSNSGTDEIPRPQEVFSRKEDCFPAHLLQHAREAILPSTTDPSCVRYVRHPIDSSILRDKAGRPVTVDRFLATKPVQSNISTRPGPGGRKLYYLTGEGVTRTLNELFGSSGWNLQIIQTTQTHCQQERGDRWMVAYTAHVRLTAGEAFREDYGAGDAQDKSLQTALQHALKASITDALKRAARHWGDVLGNSLYEKNFTIGKAPKTVQEALDLLDQERLKVWGPPQEAPDMMDQERLKMWGPPQKGKVEENKENSRQHPTTHQKICAGQQSRPQHKVATISSASSTSTATAGSGYARQVGTVRTVASSSTATVVNGPTRQVPTTPALTTHGAPTQRVGAVHTTTSTYSTTNVSAATTAGPPRPVGSVVTMPSTPAMSETRQTPANTEATFAAPWRPPHAAANGGSLLHVTPPTPAMQQPAVQNRYCQERPDTRRKRPVPEPVQQQQQQPPLKKNPYAAASL